MRTLATHPIVAKVTVKDTTSSSSMGMEQALDILLCSKLTSIDLDLDTRRATTAEQEVQQQEGAHIAADSRFRRAVTRHRRDRPLPLVSAETGMAPLEPPSAKVLRSDDC